MAKFDTPFKDNCGVDSVPTSGPQSTAPEPGLPSGMPTRTGGLLPEVIRDTTTVPKAPGWLDVKDTNFKWGGA